MWRANLFSALALPCVLLGAGTLAGVAGAQSPGPEKPPARPAYDSNLHGIIREIRVDERCRILPDAGDPPNVKPHFRRDSTLCHLESVATSSHVEEQIVGGVELRSDVDIMEQGYVLQNVTEDPAVFVVEEQVPAGWSVDSDPQPKEIDGTTAIFRVNAAPGEIVRLHVGLRHAKTKKPKRV